MLMCLLICNLLTQHVRLSSWGAADRVLKPLEITVPLIMTLCLSDTLLKLLLHVLMQIQTCQSAAVALYCCVSSGVDVVHCCGVSGLALAVEKRQKAGG